MTKDFNIDISYRQFMVEDGEAEAGYGWDETSSSQGFARSDSSVSFNALVEWGTATVHAATEGESLDIVQPERVIEVSFHVLSGSVFVNGPEEAGIATDEQTLALSVGWHRLTVSQRTIRAISASRPSVPGEIKVWLRFSREDGFRPSKIILADSELDPPPVLQEFAGPL
jgi:hypothetical protein